MLLQFNGMLAEVCTRSEVNVAEIRLSTFFFHLFFIFCARCNYVGKIVWYLQESFFFFLKNTSQLGGKKNKTFSTDHMHDKGSSLTNCV